MFYVFLKQFIVVYKNWKPINSGWLSEDASTSVQTIENSSTLDHTVVGCSSGHPSEIILKLTEEVKQLTSVVVECKLIFLHHFEDASDISLFLSIYFWDELVIYFLNII